MSYGSDGNDGDVIRWEQYGYVFAAARTSGRWRITGRTWWLTWDQLGDWLERMDVQEIVRMPWTEDRAPLPPPRHPHNTGIPWDRFPSLGASGVGWRAR